MKKPRYTLDFMAELSDKELAILYDEIVRWKSLNMLVGENLIHYYGMYKDTFGERYAAIHLVEDFLWECSLRFANRVNEDA